MSGQGDDHARMLAHVFALLSDGVADRRSVIHTPTIGTIGIDGTPRMRTVVLRAFDAPSRTLRFHTDLRSEKVVELKQDSRVSFHAYDAAGKMQIRMDGVASIHSHDALADEAWQHAQPMSRLTYTITPGPGSLIEAGGAFSALTDREQTFAGRDVFAVVVIHFTQLEWLWLASTGHRRARIRWDDPGFATHEWLVP